MNRAGQSALPRVARLIDEGNQLLAQNRLLAAEARYRQAIRLGPHVAEAHNNLGTVLKEQGQIDAARYCFEQALRLNPRYASAHSNLLFTSSYAPGQTMAGLRLAHDAWARTQLADLAPADAQALPGKRTDGPITVGLVSPDLYYHPVGVFLLPWLTHHDRARFRLIAYADNSHSDAMTHRLQSQVALWRNISGQPDEAVRRTIEDDGVDILIDLAGHTAGNRLRLFACRASPVQVSWLGYSATTGVPAMDYVLMDRYSAPSGVEPFFVERVIRLDGLRFCYTPPEYAPPVTATPALANGHVTFGSFNNLAKLAPEVLDTWSEVLQRVPGSRLLLKWKSLADAQTQERVRVEFSKRGVAPGRIECRGWSHHLGMLGEYADVDIALDPFPFSGGLTSCDALYMGVPVLTLSGALPISRQTASFLDALSLHQCIMADRRTYIDEAVGFAQEVGRLQSLRQGIRERMLGSCLCNGAGYAGAIERALSNAMPVDRRLNTPSNTGTPMKNFLHVGCGPKRKDRSTPGFQGEQWTEVRLDIDPSVSPDIIGTMTDMSAVATASMDAIFSSHNIEHLYPHEVPAALAEFKRVLKPDGVAVITCPDLQSVCALVAQDKLLEPAYTSPAGPIAPLDILYGHRPHMARGNLYMAHRCGFTLKVLTGSLKAAGFAAVVAARREHPFYDLWAVASVSARGEQDLRALAASHFPSS